MVQLVTFKEQFFYNILLLFQLMEWNESCKKNISIGFLASFRFHDSMGKLIAGTIPLAIDDINSRDDILPNHTLSYIPGDTGEPNTPMAIRKMTQMKDEGVVAFIGFEFNCASEALVAAAWNLPIITYKCSDKKVSNKTLYKTFARTLPPSSKISKAVISLLKKFNWYNVILLVAEDTSDKQIEEALVPLAKEHKIDIIQTYYIPGYYLSSKNEILSDIIDKSYERTRVYVMISEIHAVIDFSTVMYQKGLLSNGEYIIIYVEEEEIYNPNIQQMYIKKCKYFIINLSQNLDYDISPIKSVLIVTLTTPSNPFFYTFQDKVKNYSSQPPFNINFHPLIDIQVPIFSGFAYDALLLYARGLTDVLAEGGSEYDGEAIIKKLLLRRYDSILGFSVMMDENGDTEGNYTVLAVFNKTKLKLPHDAIHLFKSMQPVAHFTNDDQQNLPTIHLRRNINWFGKGPPKGEPLCGFKDEKCSSSPRLKVIIMCSICISIIVIAGTFAFRHYRYELKLACLLWKVDVKDVVLLKTNSDDALQNYKQNINVQGLTESKCSALSDPTNQDPITGRTLAKIGFYKGNVVYLRHVYKRSVDLTRCIRKELIRIREMRHENINPFLGACVDPPNICIFKLYCARGSLEEVLRNEDLDLDNVFIASLVSDLIKGMIYIHDSEIISHGNLKSSNCLVDSRWVLQITDFGLHEFQSGQELPPLMDQRRQKGLIWQAPELLRMMNPPARGTQKGDVYSFAIILYEIIGRSGPWGPDSPPVKCIVERVMNPSQYDNKVYRPPIEVLNCADYIKRCMEECWMEEPEYRPDFRLVNIKLREMQSGLKPNIFDNMIVIMEKYAYNLESLVQERTNQLVEEKKKTENLLLRMLPKSVAEQLKRGEPVEAESFDAVTIYFSDIVGFTALSAVSTPLQVVDLLNDLYTCFDSIIEHYDVYKVETIGDAYMVVSGLPIKNGNKHAGQIASMAIHLLSAIQNFEIRHRPGERLKLRIGIHSGPCVAGVVGLKMPRYCLFGDTVNTASRMESTGEALKIHVSEDCKNILIKLGGYVLQERGLTPIKGKGEMRTYWLLDQSNPTLPLNKFDTENESVTLPSTIPIPYYNEPSKYSNFLSYLNDQPVNNTLNYSCLNLLEELKKNLKKESKRSSNSYRSAPVITFKEYPSQDYIV
ncbi:guanylate cyclase 32E-like [Centruroides vittatus]|uniref:guanylate cyclase 32E-like n=1 Tax=Centruroides vittatus TaxID=120091 RepID=UPI00351071F8